MSSAAAAVSTPNSVENSPVERVTFLIEESNEHLRCLLNPETLVIRRAAGVQPRQSLGGQLTGEGLAETPLLFTGGGRTELQLDLLFDTTLAGSSIRSENVRDLTAPLWRLAENSSRFQDYRRPPQVRFLWGTHWDIPGIVVAVAERLEHFTAGGVPQRSWLRMCLVRVNEPAVSAPGYARGGPQLRPAIPAGRGLPGGLPGAGLPVHVPLGGLPGVALPPAGELPVIWDAVLTAGGIIGTAMGQTYTARALAAAFRAVREVVGTAARFVGQRLTGLVQAIGSSAAVQAIRAAVGDAVAAVERAAQATGRAAYRTISQAAQMVGSTARRMGQALADLYQQAAAAASAFSATVAAELRPVMDALGQAVDAVGTAVSQVIADIGDSPAAQAILNAGRRIAGAVKAFIESESALGRAIRQAAAVVGEAFQEIRQQAAALGHAAAERLETALAALRPLAETVGQKAVAVAEFVGTVAIAPLAAAALDIGRMGLALGRAGRVVAEAVYPHAARLAALAALHMRQGATYAGQALQTLGGEVSDTGRVAAGQIQAGLGAVQALAAGLLGQGPQMDLAPLWPALAPVGPALEQLWAAGEGKRVRLVSHHVQQVTLAGKAATAAREALADVSPQANVAAIDRDLAAIATALPQVPETAPELLLEPVAEVEFPELLPPPAPPAGVVAIQEALSRIAVTAETLPVVDSAAQQQLQATLAQLQEAANGSPVEGGAAAVAGLLPAVRGAAGTLLAAVEAAALATVKQAAATAEAGELPLLIEDPAGSGQTRLQPGERLDQVAYRYYQDPAMWRLLAYYNDVPHPLRLVTGLPLQVPPPTPPGWEPERGRE